MPQFKNTGTQQAEAAGPLYKGIALFLLLELLSKDWCPFDFHALWVPCRASVQMPLINNCTKLNKNLGRSIFNPVFLFFCEYALF